MDNRAFFASIIKVLTCFRKTHFCPKKKSHLLIYDKREKKNIDKYNNMMPVVKVDYDLWNSLKADAHRHKENRVADRKRINQNILPIRKNLMFYSLSESANKSVDFAPFWKRNKKFTWSLLTCFAFSIQPRLTSREGLGKIMMMS